MGSYLSRTSNEEVNETENSDDEQKVVENEVSQGGQIRGETSKGNVASTVIDQIMTETAKALLAGRSNNMIDLLLCMNRGRCIGILDSGCTRHVLSSRGGRLIRRWTGERSSVQGVSGDAVVTDRYAEHEILGPGLILKGYNGPHLVSLGELTRHQYKVWIQSDGGVIKLTPNRGHHGPLMLATRGRDNLYYLEVVEPESHQVAKALFAKDRKTDLVWKLHEIFAHTGKQGLKDLVKSNELKLSGLTTKDIDDAQLHLCRGCNEGKATAGPKKSNTRDLPPVGARLHVDLVQFRFKNRTVDYLVCVDEATNYVHLEWISSKHAQVLQPVLCRIIGWYRRMQDDKYGRTYPISLHSDDENTLLATGRNLMIEGVSHSTTAPGVHEKLAERAVRTLKDKIRATIRGLEWSSHFPGSFLKHLVSYIVLGVNQTPNKKTAKHSPQLLVTGRPVNGNVLQYPFGTILYCHNPGVSKDTKDLSAPKGDICIVIGRELESRKLSTFKFPDRVSGNPAGCVDRDQARQQISFEQLPKDAKDHLVELCKGEPSDHELWIAGINESGEGLLDDDGTEYTYPDYSASRGSTQTDVGPRTSLLQQPSALPEAGRSGTAGTHVRDSALTTASPRETGVNSGQQAPESDVAQGTQQVPPVAETSTNRLAQATTGTESTMDRESPETGADSGVNRPVAHESARDQTDGAQADSIRAQGASSPSTGADEEGVRSGAEPRRSQRLRLLPPESYADIHRGRSQTLRELPEAGFLAKAMFALAAWTTSATGLTLEQTEAVSKELQQLVDYKVIEPIKEVTNRVINDALDSVMLTVDKFAPDGVYLKTKARIVVKGFSDNLDADTTAPTVSLEVVLLALNIATSLEYDLDIYDVGAAFLEAHVTREVIVRIDAEFGKQLISLYPELKSGVGRDGILYVKLRKALYGLKDAPLRWYKTLVKVLENAGFVRSKYDKCLFIKTTPEGRHYVLTHVDDMLSTGPKSSMDDLRKSLKEAFAKITEQANPTEFNYLGMHLVRDRKDKTITLTQQKYINHIVERLGLTKRDIAELPHDAKLLEVKESEPLSAELKTTFASIVMTMLYVTKTRIDIKRTVIFLTTRLNDPTADDWKKMIHVAEYLNGTKHIGAVVRASSMNMIASADAAFAVHRDRKSHTGWLLRMGQSNMPFEAKSVKQALTTASSTSAELVALEAVAKELLWMREILSEMGFKQVKATPVEQDNRACMLLASRGANSDISLSRAVDIKYFWTAEKIEEGSMTLEKVDTKDLLADGLTKPLMGAAFKRWRSRVLNLTDQHD